MATTTGGQSIAYVYAEALYDVASGGGNVSAVESELLAIEQAFRTEPRLRLFLESPTIPFEDKRKVLLSALTGVSKPVLNMLCLAIEHRRISLFEAIVDGYHRHANAKAGIAEVNVAAARQLDAREIANLTAVLQKKLNQKVKIVENVKPELLGGIVVTHSGRNWDASISNRLVRMVNKIEEVKTLAPLVNGHGQ